MDRELYERLKLKNAQVNVIWRFYSDSDQQWRWQRVAFDGTILEHSKSGYAQYETCMANASESGYVFLPSSSTKPKSTAPKKKRSYMRMPTKGQKQIPKIVTGGLEQKEDTTMEDDGLGASGVVDRH